MEKSTGDCTLDYMLLHRDTIPFTLESYVQINWCGDKTVAEVIADGELAAELPEELYPEPVTKLAQ